MHKDCLLLTQGDQEQHTSCMQLINGKPLLYHIAAHLKRFHICKVVFAVSAQNTEVKDYVLAHRDEFQFAFDFSETEDSRGSGGQIMEALKYSDTPDVLIVNAKDYTEIDLDEMMAWQQSKMGDVTMGLRYEEHLAMEQCVSLKEDYAVYEFIKKPKGQSGLVPIGAYCMFRASFLNIHFPHSFSFEYDYLEKYLKERDIIGMLSEAAYFSLTSDENIEKASKYLNTKNVESDKGK